jgi:nucleoside-diphosphate-sugar epimerase
MKILVTGAGGFLAEQIIKASSKEGNEIVAMFRSGYNKELESLDNISFVKADLTDFSSLEQAVIGCDAIIHTAAFTNAIDPKRFYTVNIGGALNLFKAAREANVKTIVVTSTAGSIGPAGDNDQVTEDQYRTINFFGDYESSKFILDEKIQHLVRAGMDIRIVCPTRIFGPGKFPSKGNLISNILSNYLDGKWRFKLGDGKDSACYAFIDDVVQGHLLTLKNGRAGEKYLIGSFNDTFLGFINSFGEISGKVRYLFPIPFWVLYFYSAIAGVLAKIFKFDPVLTSDWIVKLQQNWYTDTSKAQNELGFIPHTKEEALRKTYNWLKEVKK